VLTAGEDASPREELVASLVRILAGQGRSAVATALRARCDEMGVVL
jgi:hypothetical protein